MLKRILLIHFCLSIFAVSAQFNPANPPNDCSEAIPGCVTPSFPISPNVPGTNNVDFGINTVSNPSVNPNSLPGNSGCLLSGETSSTFIIITIVSSGTLAWSIQGSNGGCFDWIMWPYTNPSLSCSQIANAQLAPVACNWNAPCQGFTGMAPIGQLPSGGNQGNFENSINVLGGQQFLLCLSNFSGTTQNVNLNFFGTANVACGPSAPDRTICQGGSSVVNILTPGFQNPQFLWLVTNGVSNISQGSNVTVTPTVTTTYQVKVIQPSSGLIPLIIDTAVFTVFVENPPVPNAGLDDTICLGAPIQLSGLISNVGNSKSWNYFSQGITPAPVVNFSPNFSTLSPLVQVSKPGMYGFILRETSPVCGVRRDTVKIFVNEMTAQVQTSDANCFGGKDGQISLSGPQAYQYSYDNGLSWTQNADSIGFGVGTYQVCVRNTNGCKTCTTAQINDGQQMSLSVFGDTLICENGTATLSAQASGGSSFTYHWGNIQETTGNYAAKPLSDTIYMVKAVNENGCESEVDTLFVQVRAGISGLISTNDTICLGENSIVQSSAQGGLGGPYTFQWSNGIQGSGHVNQTQYSPTTSQLVSVSIKDNCESTPLVLSTFIALAENPSASFEVDTNVLCEPAQFDLKLTSASGSFISSQWLIGDKDIYLNNDSIVTLPLIAGSYDVELVVSNRFGCLDTLVKMDYLKSIKKPEAKIVLTSDAPSIFSPTASFMIQSNEAVSHEWFFDEGIPSYSTDNNPKVTFPEGEEKSYETMLIVKNNFGCIDSILHEVKIMPEMLVFAPNSFTPNGDGLNDQWVIHVRGIEASEFDLELVNRWGQLIWKTNKPNEGWDGFFQGEKVQEGGYTWVLKVRDSMTQDVYLRTGLLNITR